MGEALLYDKLDEQRVRCNVCLWRCLINPGKSGVCGVRRNENGSLQLLNYGLVSSLAADPIEKKPLFHFFPGSSVLSFGTIGCNFHCIHCQNWEIACIEDPGTAMKGLREISPQDAVKIAVKNGCAGLAWTYNEPTVWFEYTLDSARMAHENGLYSVYVTNGYMTPEALDMLGPYLDAWRVDIKGFSDKLYRDLAKVGHWRKILEVAERARHKWNMHVEVVTNVIPSMNDDDKQLKAIAGWIREALGELTPWHVTRFHPHRRLSHLQPTGLAVLERAHDIGRAAGLRFVYLGNVPGHAYENTVCYQCGALAIERRGYSIRLKAVKDSCCAVCGADLNIRTSIRG
ncbi:MAG: AmmeMemoRadiSam system radical SAM enzyme [Dehalococcoidia bacterium]|nr:AmmeMemoRadiSam system radical SAM enzyme [Dehalococcoidia bacterium]